MLRLSAACPWERKLRAKAASSGSFRRQHPPFPAGHHLGRVEAEGGGIGEGSGGAVPDPGAVSVGGVLEQEEGSLARHQEEIFVDAGYDQPRPGERR